MVFSGFDNGLYSFFHVSSMCCLSLATCSAIQVLAPIISILSTLNHQRTNLWGVLIKIWNIIWILFKKKEGREDS